MLSDALCSLSLCVCSVVMYASIIAIVFCFFFFKQKTAYEMRISDWSSDVCSSDLTRAKSRQLVNRANIKPFCGHGSTSSNDRERPDFCYVLEIGRASCRERVCQYV